MKKYFLIILFLSSCLAGILHGQKTDSLLLLLSQSKEDTGKINLYFQLVEQLRFSGEGAKKYAEKALELSLKTGFKKGVPKAYYYLARHDYYTSSYNESFVNSQKAFSLFKEAGDTSGMAMSLMCIGEANYSIDNFSQSLIYFDSSLALFKIINSEIGIANCLMSKGDVRYVQDEYHLALLNFKEALELYEKNHSLLGIANCTNCIADVLFDQQDYIQAQEKYLKAKSLFYDLEDNLGLANCTKRLGDINFRLNKYGSALEYFLEAQKFYEESGSINGLGNTKRNIGEVFLRQNNYSGAISKTEEAMAIFFKTGDDMGLAGCYNTLSMIKKMQGKIPEALNYSEKSYQLAVKIETPELIQVSAFELGELYSGLKLFEKAYFYQRLYSQLKDSIKSNENIKKITRLQMQIDFEQKQREQELILKQKELEHSIELTHEKIARNSFIAGFIVVLILAFFIYKNFRNKQKANEILAEKNQIIELKNKEITDSIEYAQHIQKAMLVSEDTLKTIFSDYFVLFIPRDIISGDFYWGAPLNRIQGNNMDNRGGIIAVADCTGHGVPGALMSMIGNTLLNKIVIENKIETPSIILDFLRKGIIEILHQKGGDKDSRDGMDMALCKIERIENQDQSKTANGNNRPLQWKLEYAGAHNPVWIIKNKNIGSSSNVSSGLPGSLIELRPDNIPVGFYWGTQKKFTNHSIHLESGDMVYLFSDGLADQFGGDKKKKFKLSRLKELLLSIQTKSMEEQRKILYDTMEKWKGSLEQVDDICMIGVRV